ncbi:MAG: glycosyltransferase [Candidatus Microthrix parvicella]
MRNLGFDAEPPRLRAEGLTVAIRRGRKRPDGTEALVMLVTSSGGHLSHLLELSGFWQRHRRVWVSFDLPDVVSRLRGEEVVWAHHPTARNLPNLARNLVMAWRELRRRRPDLIVSTGAGVAVPFFWLGRLMGIKTAYLEVYDRIDSTTMTGRLVRRVSDAVLVQWPEQGSLYPNAQVMGTIWPDAPIVAVNPRGPNGAEDDVAMRRAGSHPALVVVTVGTDSHRFGRLVTWAGRWADDHADDAQVVIQRGTAPHPGGVAYCPEALDIDELLELMSRADAVVCAAGPGTVMDALRAGVKPLVVPRNDEMGEHVDGHQVAFAKVLVERGVTLGANTESELRAQLDRVMVQPGWCSVTPLSSAPTPGGIRISAALEALMSPVPHDTVAHRG